MSPDAAFWGTSNKCKDSGADKNHVKERSAIPSFYAYQARRLQGSHLQAIIMHKGAAIKGRLAPPQLQRIAQPAHA